MAYGRVAAPSSPGRRLRFSSNVSGLEEPTSSSGGRSACVASELLSEDGSQMIQLLAAPPGAVPLRDLHWQQRQGSAVSSSSQPYSGASGSARMSRRSATPSVGNNISTARPYHLGGFAGDANLSTPDALLREMREKEATPRTSTATTLVAPPWGPERANQDAPPYEKVRQRRLNYHRMLDEQSKLKGQEEGMQISIPSGAGPRELRGLAGTSFETSVHTWDLASVNKTEKQRAIFKELVSTAESKQKQAKQERDVERKDYAKWAAQAEREQAYMYQMQRTRQKEEWMNLADEWKATAKEKQKRHEAERAAQIREEREAIDRVTKGMVPHRRMKRSVDMYEYHQPAVPLTAR